MSGEAAAKVTETIAELGQKTETVMVLREALYRLNEMQINNANFQTQEVVKLYEDVLKAVTAIAEGDAKKAQADC